MRVSSLGVARPAPYDRNATSSANQFSNSVSGGSGAVTDFTVTVASGKKILIEYAQVFFHRETVATTSTRVEAYVRVTVGGNPYDIARVDGPLTNTANATSQDKAWGAITIYAGEDVRGIHRNSDTGGSVYMLVAYKGTQFDA